MPAPAPDIAAVVTFIRKIMGKTGHSRLFTDQSDTLIKHYPIDTAAFLFIWIVSHHSAAPFS
jgi:hypothetical protein